MTTIPKTILPNEQDTRIARTSWKALAALVSKEGQESLHFRTEGDSQTELTLTLPTLHLLLEALQEIGKGNGVTLTPVQKHLTTQQAADLLRVSRPYLIEELLEKGKIPYRKVGNRRRIRYEDLLRYQEEEEQEISRREQVMRELMAETERLGLYE